MRSKDNWNGFIKELNKDCEDEFLKFVFNKAQICPCEYHLNSEKLEILFNDFTPSFLDTIKGEYNIWGPILNKYFPTVMRISCIAKEKEISCKGIIN